VKSEGQFVNKIDFIHNYEQVMNNELTMLR